MSASQAQRRREATDIDQHVYTRFEEIGLPRNQVRRDISTAASGRKRGDLWISQVQDADSTFEDEIVALIENVRMDIQHSSIQIGKMR